MKKVIVIGCPGSGKSTLSRSLAEKTALPLYHLDRLYWNADGTVVERDVFLARLTEVLRGDAWIIDGNYPSTMEMRMAAADTVIFLDYPTRVCLAGIRGRIGQPRPDMPWVEKEEDAALVELARRFKREQRPRILSLIKASPDKRVLIFRSREETNAYIRGAVSDDL